MISPVRGTLGAAVGSREVPGEFVAVVVGPHAEAQTDLPELIQASGLFGAPLRQPKRGQQERREDRNDGNNHQQFNQGERIGLSYLSHAIVILIVPTLPSVGRWVTARLVPTVAKLPPNVRAGRD